LIVDMAMEETGMDPEVRRYFRKIMNSFAFGLLWMLTLSTVGLYMGLAYVGDRVRWHNIAFYIFCILSFAALLRYYYKTWKGN
jgi:hypothetical protein